MVQGEDLEESKGLDRLQGQQGLPGQAGGHWEGGVGVSQLHEDSREAILLSTQSGKNLDCCDSLDCSVKAIRADLDGIKKGGEEATVWLREVCRGKSLVGHVIARQGERLSIVLYDTTVEDLDININKEMIDLGLTAMKEA